MWLKAEPAVRTVPLPAAGAEIVLCSDGVWDAIGLDKARRSTPRARERARGGGERVRACWPTRILPTRPCAYAHAPTCAYAHARAHAADSPLPHTYTPPASLLFPRR
eukprot:21429-Pleurochrysis_carterae.AAC.1